MISQKEIRVVSTVKTIKTYESGPQLGHAPEGKPRQYFKVISVLSFVAFTETIVMYPKIKMRITQIRPLNV